LAIILGSEVKSKLKRLVYTALLVAIWSGVKPPPVYGVSKETLQMLQQLDTLQQMVQNMQKTVDSQTAILRTLVEQANDKVNSMKTTVEDLQKSTEKSLASSSTRFDSMTSQIQALNESLEEAKARLAKLSDQVAQTQNIIQTLNTPAAPASGTATASPPGSDPATKPVPSVPDADVLYKSGISAYNAGQYALSIQAFQDYLKYYGDTDQASSAQFYIGDCYYNQKDFPRAVAEYNKCLERYPNGNKLPAAQLKKGYALIAIDQKAAGVRELKSLMQRYPNSREAALASQKLRQLGIIVRASRSE
jgi:tol-pal system protein YbgF